MKVCTRCGKAADTLVVHGYEVCSYCWSRMLSVDWRQAGQEMIADYLSKKLTTVEKKGEEGSEREMEDV